METWRAKRKEQRAEFESTTAAWTDTLNSATTNNTQALGTLAAQRALERLKAKQAAKQAASQAAISGTAENPSGFTALENIAARYRDLAVGSAVNIST
jgi:ferric-dicitrate binding protein FerR (iron transport regulator)